MTETAFLVLGIAVGSIIGAIISHYYNRNSAKSWLAQAREQAASVLEDAETRARDIEVKAEQRAEEEEKRKSKQLERDLSKRRHELDRKSRKLSQKESTLDRKFQVLDEKQAEMAASESELAERKAKIEKDQQRLKQQLEETARRCQEVSGMTVEEAKKLTLELMESEVRMEAAALVRKVEAETKELANKKARQIITLAIQRCSTEQVAETTVSVLNLPNDEMKGRIIGREGRNIRALEAATGCNIIVDDTPEAVVLSCFDPLRREIARQALERLLDDGRIHPTRIEEVVAKVEKEMAEHIREMGEQTVLDLGISDMHPEIIRTLGRLKYRSSYGQNMLTHSIEVAQLCGYLAEEIGADAETAKRAGLLHDIGKALSYEMQGTHAMIGAELAKRCNETPGVVHAIAAHHNEEEPRTIVAVLVQAADTLSSARPGSRRESLETYVKRLEKLEQIADTFQGVTKAYAIQAGRELRVMVEPTEVNDNEAALLAREITKKIEEDLEYPGQIKVTVCRETRAVEYAK